MAINLKSLQKHSISRDLSGYITYIYGPGGAGKTTLGSQMPQPLILAAEKGYSAIADVYAQDITSWTDIKQILRQLDDPEVKGMFKSLIVDTVDKMTLLCEKYVCQQLGIQNIGDGGWATNGWSKVKKEWEQTWNAMTMKGYAILFISHSKDKTFTRKDGSTYNQIVPSCPNTYNEIITNMVDLQGYIDVKNNERKLILRSPDGLIECKSRFKYITPEIDFSYESLVEALNNAIDKEGQMKGAAYITDKRETGVEAPEYNYEELLKEFNATVSQLMKEDSNFYAPRITQCIERTLGKGKKVSEATIDQVELIALIIEDIKAIKK